VSFELRTDVFFKQKRKTPFLDTFLLPFFLSSFFDIDIQINEESYGIIQTTPCSSSDSCSFCSASSVIEMKGLSKQ